MLMMLTFVILIFGISLAIATAQEKILLIARTNTRTVKRMGAFVLLGIGIWLIALAIYADFFAQIFLV